jgi:hypothetical protein
MVTSYTYSPNQKALRTARWARTMTKWLVTYSCRRGVKWRFVEFGGATGAESYGIVDIVAIRKNHRPSDPAVRRGDLFDIVLIQTKGGSAPFPSPGDIDRLVATAAYHRAKAVVLATWKLGTRPQLYQLVDRGWSPCEPLEIFG